MTKMKKPIYISISIIIVAIIFLIINFSIDDYHNDIKRHPQMYCYDNLRKGLNINALYISNLSNKDEYLEYYKKLENRKEPSFSFPLKAIPFNKSVYILDTLKEDSNIIKIYFYCEENRYYECNTACYLYNKLLHPQKSSHNDMENK